jgi:hypothetical protein
MIILKGINTRFANIFQARPAYQLIKNLSSLSSDKKENINIGTVKKFRNPFFTLKIIIYKMLNTDWTYRPWKNYINCRNH